MGTKASPVLVALLVAGAVLPAHGRPPELADADLLYCARAYAEGALLLKADPGAGVRRLARDAQGRAQVLAAAASDLRTADAGRHQQASDLAGQRLAAMPAMPPEARRLALRAAYAECRYLEAGKGRTAATAVAAESAVPGKDSPATPAASTPVTPAPASTPAMLAAATSAATAAGAATASSAAPAGTLPATPATVSPTSGAGAPSPTVPAGKPAAAAVTAPAPTPAAMTPPPSPATASRKEAEATPAAAKMAAGSSLARTGASTSARPPLPSPPTAPGAATGGLGDTDLLYCAQVYAETASMLEGETNADLRRLATDALQRSRALTERDADLLNEHPARHSRARIAARQRLAALPEQPGRGRSVALRGAYDECLALEARAATATAPSAAGDRVQMLARRHFCRDLLLSKLKVSAKLRAALSPSEQAALDETRRIGEALAQPLEGAPLTLDQDREANRLMAKFREELDLATANWRGGTDPVVQALGQCSDDYAQGLLGGPDVLAADEAATPVAAPAAAEPAKAAVVQPADLGAVFHMRETTPAGTVDGLWFRRGRSNVYDAIWVQAGNGQVQRDVLELRGIVDGELTVYRQGFRGSYRARVRADGTLAPGTASWFDSAAYAWGPLPSQPVRGADLGAIVHMREVTPQGNYEGLWRQRGDTGVYDVLWVFLPTGEVSADVLAVTGVARGNLVIRRLDGPCLYPVARRAVALRAGGVPPLSKWVVLPPQALRLRNASR